SSARPSRLPRPERRLPAGECRPRDESGVEMTAAARPDATPASVPMELPHLGPLEQAVMNVLWRSCEVNDEPLPIRAVVDQMPDLAYTTVATVLSNLKRKGMVEQLRDQPVLRYRPARGR